MSVGETEDDAMDEVGSESQQRAGEITHERRGNALGLEGEECRLQFGRNPLLQLTNFALQLVLLGLNTLSQRGVGQC